MEPQGLDPRPGIPREVLLPVGVEVTHVRGLIQNIVKGVLSQGLDAEAWAAYMSGLSAGAREQLDREAGEYEWVSMAGLVEAVAKHPGGREGVLAVLRGNLYADLMMTEKHRWMLKVMTPELMVRQAPRIYAFYHRGGRMEAERVEPGRATVTLRATGPSPAWFSILLTTWFKRSLELSGATAVEAVHEPPEATGKHDLHRYWLAWIEA